MNTRLVTALLVLALGASFVASQPYPNLNEFQERLLALEAETPRFRHFQGLTIEDLLARSARGESPSSSELDEVKEEAAALQVMAVHFLNEADSLSEGLYLAPGVELDAEMMYRVSAWELGRFFMHWSSILTKVQDAEPTSPESFWQFTEELERASNAYDSARIYRLLANQQYILENELLELDKTAVASTSTSGVGH